jgi:hypothetical protein
MSTLAVNRNCMTTLLESPLGYLKNKIKYILLLVMLLDHKQTDGLRGQTEERDVQSVTKGQAHRPKTLPHNTVLIYFVKMSEMI